MKRIGLLFFVACIGNVERTESRQRNLSRVFEGFKLGIKIHGKFKGSIP